MRRLIIAAALLAPLATQASDAPTKDDFAQVVRNFLTDQNCRMNVTNDSKAEQKLAEAFETAFGIPAAEILDKKGPYYEVVDDAFDDLRDSGAILVDREQGELILNDCRPSN